MEKFRYHDNVRLFAQCGTLALLIILSLYVPYINVISLALSVLFVMTLETENALCITFFLVSFAPIFKLQLGGFSLLNLVILSDIIKKMLSDGIKLKGRAGTALFLLVIYTCVSCLFYRIADWISFISYLIFAYYWYKPKRVKLDFHKILTFFILGIMVTSTVALFSDQIPRLQSIMSEATIRLSAGNYYYRFSGLDPNPNYYTMSLSVCIAAIAVLIHSKQATVLDYVYLAAMTGFGLMTASQSFLLCYAVTWALFVLLGGIKRIWTVLPALLILCLVLVAVLNFLDESTLSTILFRFDSVTESDSMTSVTSGRSALWISYIAYLLQNPITLILGRCIGAPNLPVGASHNYYIDIIYHLGIFGACIYLSFLLALFKPNKLGKVEAFRYIPLISFLIRATARNMIMSEQLVFLLIICSLAFYDGYYSKLQRGAEHGEKSKGVADSI